MKLKYSNKILNKNSKALEQNVETTTTVRVNGMKG
jgi:hypothetical protein